MDEFYDYLITTDFLINTTMHKIVHYSTLDYYQPHNSYYFLHYNNEENNSYYMVGNNPVLTVILTRHWQ